MGGSDYIPTVDEVVGALRLHAPEFASLAIGAFDHGWDNTVVRIGTSAALRIPRRAGAISLLEHESRWLPVLAPLLPLPVPSPFATHPAAKGFPVPWSIVPWIHGTPLDHSGGRLGPPAVPLIAALLETLDVPAPEVAPTNPFRGVPLRERDRRVREYLSQVPEPERGALTEIWVDALSAEPFTDAPRWIHGDLHPANLVVDGSVLAGVIDWGDLAAGDPATDLSIAWTACDRLARASLRTVLERPDDTWRRARGNALAHGLACLAGRPEDSRIAGIGRSTIAALLED